MQKILHVCTFGKGGAAIAAKRQCDALRKIGCDSTFMSLRIVRANDVSVDASHAGRLIVDVPEHQWSYVGAVTTNYCVGNRTQLSNTWFSLWPSLTTLDQTFLEIFSNYDVLHFHWTSGIFSSRLADELSRSGKTIVFTGHDMNYFTGGCHYDAGCSKYRTSCIDCPQLAADPLEFANSSFTDKIEALSSLKATWIFPSVWLSEEFRMSRLGDKPAVVLPNCINEERFFPVSDKMRGLLRERFGLSRSEVVIVAGAQDNREIRKGVSVLQYAVSKLAGTCERQGIEAAIVTFGGGKPDFVEYGGLRHVHLETISEAEVARLFQTADLIAFPSFEDNFPNVVLEGLLCACPVLAFRVGGVPDIVEHGVNGRLVEPLDMDAFTHELIDLVADLALQNLRTETFVWAKKNQDRYAPEPNARALLRIYDETLPDMPADSGAGRLADGNLELYESVFSLPEDCGLRASYQFAHGLSSLVSESSASQRRRCGPAGQLCPRIWLDAPEEEFSEQTGTFRWARMNNRLIFLSGAYSEHLLLFQIPATEKSEATFRSVEDDVVLRINGSEVPLSWEAKKAERNYWYVIGEVPSDVLAKAGKPNLAVITVAEPSVPLEWDSRGICFVFSRLDVVAYPKGKKPRTDLLGLAFCSGGAVAARRDETLVRSCADYIDGSAVIHEA